MASIGEWQAGFTNTYKQLPVRHSCLKHDQLDVTPNRESHTEEQFGVTSPTEGIPYTLYLHKKCFTVFPGLVKCSLYSCPPSIVPFPLQDLSSQKENRPSGGFSIELSEASCFNNSCKIKGKGTFVKSLHPERSSGGLWQTLYCKVCPVILSCLCVCPCR